MSAGIARAPLKLLRLRGVRRLLRPLLRDRAAVFMLHRFHHPDLGIEGHDPASVRALLGFLRREGFRLVPLRQVFAALRSGEPLEGAVAFTIDDGYLDQAEIAGPLFAEFDCPVSTFLCTGFLDRQFWMWWDQIEYAMEHSRLRAFEVSGSSARWADATERRRVQLQVIEHCKTLPERQKRPFVDGVAKALDVEIPATPPGRYAPMSWDDARLWEKRGMSFGPHTLTHAILSRADAEQSHHEIEGSRSRLAQELEGPDPIFCYPNGQADDFGGRECATLAQLGLAGAVTGLPGYAHAGSGSDALYRVRRFSFPEQIDDLLQCVSGFEHLKSRLRAEA